MCAEWVEDPYPLEFFTVDLITPETCKEAAKEDLYAMEFVLMDLITQEMCNYAIRKATWNVVYGLLICYRVVQYHNNRELLHVCLEG